LTLFLFHCSRRAGRWMSVAAVCGLITSGCSPAPDSQGGPDHVLHDHPVLEHKFHQANQCVKNGQPAPALRLYAEISAQLAGTSHTDIFSNLFAGTVELRRGACLIELGRHQEARTILESMAMQRYLKAFDSATTYDYCLVYGNLLGSMKQFNAMDALFRKGLAVATEELRDPEKVQEIWLASLKWGRQSQDWKYLEIQCRRALAYGRQNEDILVQHAASEAQCFADAGLGNFKKARKEIQQVIQRMKKLHEPAQKIEDMRRLWESVAGK